MNNKTLPSDSGRTLLLSDDLINKMISLDEAIHLVEAGFAADGVGSAVALPVVVQAIDAFDAHFGVKSGYLSASRPASAHSALLDYLSANVGDVLGLKAGGYWYKNSELGLPGHRAVLLLLEPNTGSPVAVMSANSITRMRTAAAGAVAAKYLARRDSQTVGIIGAGDQAHAQLQALSLHRRIRRVYVWARRPAAAEEYASAWKQAGLHVEISREISPAIENADIIITATPSKNALVNSDWVRPGTHITAVGSDGSGKQELDVRLLQRAKVVVDKAQQSLEIGELQHALKEGLNAGKMIHAELGEICAGLKTGRENDEEITIFDSTGVNFQDLVVAAYLVRKAKSEGLGEYVLL